MTAYQLTKKEGEFLVNLARKAVDKYVETGETIRVPEDTPANLMEHHGVFVTIHTLRNGKRELRGCIGHPYQATALAHGVIDCAISSATRDPRFYPLSTEELDDTVFEISVLTKPELIEVDNPKHFASRIRVGRDGLIVERGSYKGLLLPQVPVELDWDESEFLGQCCIKAGLTPDIWLVKSTKIYKFQCIIAREISPRGAVEIVGPDLSHR